MVLPRREKSEGTDLCLGTSSLGRPPLPEALGAKKQGGTVRTAVKYFIQTTRHDAHSRESPCLGGKDPLRRAACEQLREK